MPDTRIAFIGGGNMASALIAGLIKSGLPNANIAVVEPNAEARERLLQHYNVAAEAAAGPFLSPAQTVVWAVKPQVFKEAALQVRFYAREALHLSVAAGIRSESIAHWLSSQRVVRAMPNTPALIGKGITALYARAGVTPKDQYKVEEIVTHVGEFLWLAAEDKLDAVTALSGSGPAYVYYFMEAMTAAGADLGLSREHAYKLAVATFIGAGELAKASKEPPEILRQRVTSKGGTTAAAIESMDDSNIKPLIVRALHIAAHRAKELGDEFGLK
jgi:pyrroline-5-carboxylate reductase